MVGKNLKDKKLKKKTKKWLSKRHNFVCNLLRPFFKLYFRLKYKLTVSKDEKKLDGPALIMSNHSTTLDPFILGTSFKRPLYYIASDDLFTIPVASRLIRWLINPIPKSKSKSDFNTIRTTLKVIKEGGTVAVFPEGNRTLYGTNWEIDISTAKFAKMCKVPLVLYKIEGGYGADPRWGNKIRKGKMTAGVVKVYSAEEINKLSAEELLAEIRAWLTTTDISSGVNFKYRRRAEYLERALYYCSNCGSFNTLRSEKDEIYCINCDFKAKYEESLTFSPVSGKLCATNTGDYLIVQREKLLELSKNKQGVLFSDKELEVRKIYDKKRHKVGYGTLLAYANGVELDLKGEKVFYDFSTLYGVTILGKRKINFYLDADKTLQIKGSKRFNAIKYLHLYEFVKEEI